MMPHRLRLAITALILAATLLPGAARSQSAAPTPVDQGIQLFHARRYTEARALLLPFAKANPKHAAAAYWLGRAFYQDALWNQASDWLERAVKLEDGNADYHFWYGAALGAQAQRASKLRQPFLAKKIRSELDRAVELDPDHLDARAGLVTFYLAAPGVMGGSTQKAREQALEIRKRNAYLGGFQLARVALDQKDSTAAFREYEALIQTFPDSAAPYHSLVSGLLAAGRADDAFRTIDRFIERNPGNMVGQYMLGRAGASTGQQLDRAEAALRQYLAYTPAPNEPTHAGARWRLGQIAERRGDQARARSEYEAALKLDPSLRGAQEALKRLK